MEFDRNRDKDIAVLAERCTGFQWDAGNIGKNFKKHGVSDGEAEEVFQSWPLVFYDDKAHSAQEERYTVLGRNSGNSLRTVVFTIRGLEIRVISARPMSVKDKKLYEEAT